MGAKCIYRVWERFAHQASTILRTFENLPKSRSVHICWNVRIWDHTLLTDTFLLQDISLGLGPMGPMRPADLRPYLNAGSLNKLIVDHFEKLAPGIFKFEKRGTSRLFKFCWKIPSLHHPPQGKDPEHFFQNCKLSWTNKTAFPRGCKSLTHGAHEIHGPDGAHRAYGAPWDLLGPPLEHRRPQGSHLDSWCRKGCIWIFINQFGTEFTKLTPTPC